MLLVTEKDAAAPTYDDARHGLTPPMRDARQRHFRPLPNVPSALVSKTEQDLLAILAVRGALPLLHMGSTPLPESILLFCISWADGVLSLHHLA